MQYIIYWFGVGLGGEGGEPLFGDDAGHAVFYIWHCIESRLKYIEKKQKKQRKQRIIQQWISFILFW